MMAPVEFLINGEPYTAFCLRVMREDEEHRERERAAASVAAANRWEKVALIDLSGLPADQAEALAWTFAPRHYRTRQPDGEVIRFVNLRADLTPASEPA